ncbi:asparaginase domain-containing protein [Sulfurimonas sp. HSL-1716]|uniref:asparaginase domain-containing protein n=1 Tax=Hydrocurvibacter sulfurireducens TaxID=3131937 RepID=UPI0031F83E16
MKILNTGGTFNKRYNPLNGQMQVAFDNKAIEKMMEGFIDPVEMAGVIYKDSLEFTSDDRKMLANVIYADEEDVFIIVHGTDTMDVTAGFLDAIFDDRIIILTGAMTPFEIDNTEASVNFGMALGYAKSCKQYGVYICMNGEILPYDKLVKNKSLGKFEIV